MIPANELRIGNHVQYWNETQWEPAIVGGMQSNIQVFIVHNEKQKWVDFRELSPIPLTPELLEKAGFEIYSVSTYTKVLLSDQSSTLNLFADKEEAWFECCGFHGDQGSPVISIKYLHQLQNLIFALSGTELEIKL